MSVRALLWWRNERLELSVGLSGMGSAEVSVRARFLWRNEKTELSVGLIGRGEAF